MAVEDEPVDEGSERKERTGNEEVGLDLRGTSDMELIQLYDQLDKGEEKVHSQISGFRLL